MKDVLATIGALLMMVSTIPYALDIVRKKTRPNVVTWITWTLLTAIATAATFAVHEPRTAFLTLGSCLSTLLIVILGTWYGIAKLSLFDVACQLLAIIGLLLWLLFNSPLIAIIATVAIDFVGFLPTLRHAWLKPQEETWQAFAWSVLAIAFTLASLTNYSAASLVYPLYLFLADGLLTITIILRRQKLSVLS